MHWKFDRLARLEHVVERHLLMLKYLRAERLDTPRNARERIDWRIKYTEERMVWLRSVARTMRHNRRWVAKLAETSEQLVTT